METPKDFAAQVAADKKAQQHAQEILNTRVGGLGGSDATLVLKIGQKGMAALSATDTKRLAIMLGLLKQDDFGGNIYTKAGHAFEDYAERHLPLGCYQREQLMTVKLARSFKTFAHADFVFDNENVVECKFVQQTTQATVTKYAAQLQWYFLMGAKKVFLYHGIGNADPFEVEEATLTEIERDEDIINFLFAGLQTLDQAIENGWQLEVTDKCAYEDTPEIVQHAFDKLAEIKAKEKELAAQKDEVILILKTYCEDFNFSNIKNTETGAQVIYSKAGVSRTFDSKKFASDHPNMDLSKYFRTATKAASITFK